MKTKQLRIPLSDLPTDKELGPLEPSEDMVNLARLGGTVLPVLVASIGNKYSVLHGSREIKAARLANLTDASAVVVDLADHRDDEVLAAYVNSMEIKNSIAYKLDVMYSVIARGGVLDDVMRIIGCGEKEARTLHDYTRLPIEVVQAVVAGTVRENLLRALVGAPAVVKESVGSLIAKGVTVTPKEVRVLIDQMRGQTSIMDMVDGTNILSVRNHGDKLTIDIYHDGKPVTVVISAKELLERQYA